MSSKHTSRRPDPLTSLPSTKKPPISSDDVVADSEAQWIFTEDEVANTPSIVDGMPLEKEREVRQKGLSFIMQVGIMLRLPQLTLSTAGIFFNRFLMRHSLVQKENQPKPLHHYQVAATSLFLATKTEENCRKLKDLIIAFCRVAQKSPQLHIDEQSKDYWRWRDTILYNEDVLLEALCFDLTVESPHKLLFDLLKALGVEHNKRLRNAAWSFVNDSSLTVLCLLFSPRTIAAAAIYCGAKSCIAHEGDDGRASVPFLDDDGTDGGKPWWLAISASKNHTVRLRDLKRACNFMADVHENSPPGSAAGAGTASGEQSIYVGLRTPVPAPGPEEERSGTNGGAQEAHPSPGGDERGTKRDIEGTPKPWSGKVTTTARSSPDNGSEEGEISDDDGGANAASQKRQKLERVNGAERRSDAGSEEGEVGSEEGEVEG